MGQFSTLEMKLAKAIALLILVSVPALVSAQIKKAKKTLELFLTKEPSKASLLAAELVKLNGERKTFFTWSCFSCRTEIISYQANK